MKVNPGATDLCCAVFHAQFGEGRRIDDLAVIRELLQNDRRTGALHSSNSRAIRSHQAEAAYPRSKKPASLVFLAHCEASHRGRRIVLGQRSPRSSSSSSAKRISTEPDGGLRVVPGDAKVETADGRSPPDSSGDEPAPRAFALRHRPHGEPKDIRYARNSGRYYAVYHSAGGRRLPRPIFTLPSVASTCESGSYSWADFGNRSLGIEPHRQAGLRPYSSLACRTEYSPK